MNEIKYELSFEDTIENINNDVDRWFAGPRNSPPDVEHYAEPVYFKSAQGILVHNNEPYRKFFSRGVVPVGRIAASFLHNSVVTIARHADALIAAGVQQLMFEHSCFGPDNKWYFVKSYKRRLVDFNDGAYEILGVSRPVHFEEMTNSVHPLEQKFETFANFTSKDKRLCVLIAEGLTSVEIGKLLDVSSKTVDNRRKKIMNQLQFQLPIDIVKMLVRFEERGFEI